MEFITLPVGDPDVGERVALRIDRIRKIEMHNAMHNATSHWITKIDYEGDREPIYVEASFNEVIEKVKTAEGGFRTTPTTREPF